MTRFEDYIRLVINETLPKLRRDLKLFEDRELTSGEHGQTDTIEETVKNLKRLMLPMKL